MKRFLVRLYPARWRARYGDEFEALLDERPLSPFDVADVILGAVDAHAYHGRDLSSKHRKGPRMTPRLGGQAAVVGGFLMLIGLPLTNGGTFPGAFVLLAGAATLVLAMVGLSALGSRQHPLLVWAAVVIPTVGIVMCWLGALAWAFTGESAYYEVVAFLLFAGLLTMFAGSALFVAVTYRRGGIRPWAVRALGLGTGLLLVPMVLFNLHLPPGIGNVLSVLLVVGTVAFPIGWMAVGWSAIEGAGGTPLSHFVASDRAAGLAAVTGSSFWLARLGLMYGPNIDARQLAHIGTGLFIFALIGFTVRHTSSRAWVRLGACGIAAAGFAVSLAADVAMAVGQAPYSLYVLPFAQRMIVDQGAVYVGTALFAALAYRTGELPRPPLAILMIAAPLFLTSIVLRILGVAGTGPAEAAGLVLFAVGWMWIGWSAFRSDPHTLAARPA